MSWVVNLWLSFYLRLSVFYIRCFLNFFSDKKLKNPVFQTNQTACLKQLSAVTTMLSKISFSWALNLAEQNWEDWTAAVRFVSCCYFVLRRQPWKLQVLKSLSEALMLGSSNPQYDKRLFIDLQVQYIKTTSSEHGENMLWAKIVLNVKNKKQFFCTTWTCSPHVLSLYF